MTSAYRHTSPPPSDRASLPYGRYAVFGGVSHGTPCCRSSVRKRRYTLPVRTGTYGRKTHARTYGPYVRAVLTARTYGKCVPAFSRQQGRLLLLSAGRRLPTVVVQAAVHSQRRCSTCILLQAFGAHHSASPRASLAAVSGTDNIPSLRSDTTLPQRISAGIPRREHSSDSRRGKTPSSITVVHNNNACRSASAEIYPK